MNPKANFILNISLVGAILILSLLLNKSCNKNKDYEGFEEMYNASMDSLHKERDKLGREKTTTALLYGDVESLKKLNASKDSTLAKLQKLVNKHTISATVFSTSTGNTVSSGTMVKTETIIVKGDSVFIYPVYSTKFKNRWEDFDITADRDTFLISYKVFNEYEYKQEFKRQGFLKPRAPVVSVTNQNPNTETLELKSFAVKPDKRSRWKNIAIGAVAGLAAGYVIFKK